MMKTCTLLFACLTLSHVFAAEGANLNITDHLKLSPQTQGMAVKATINFSNDGDTPLTIEKVKTPCGCTTVDLSGKTLQPGESGSFDVNIRTARLNGTYDKSLTILSDDADEPQKKVRITFDVTTEETAE